MQIKKSGGKIFGANMTAAEKKAMEMEIKRQLGEYNRKNEMELDAIILWELHEQLGFGPVRLKRFFDNFGSALADLLRHYEMGSDDQCWLCTEKLKEYGIDINEWYKNKKEENMANIRVTQEKDHYVAYVNGERYCSGDTYAEVTRELINDGVVM